MKTKNFYAFSLLLAAGATASALDQDSTSTETLSEWVTRARGQEARPVPAPVSTQRGETIFHKVPVDDLGSFQEGYEPPIGMADIPRPAINPPYAAYSFPEKLTTSQQRVVEALAKGKYDLPSLVRPGDDVTTPYGQYTLLMMVSGDLGSAKYLIEQCHADVNEAVWQPRWGYYVTALDTADWGWNPKEHTTQENEAHDAALNYLKSKGAKPAGNLGFWRDFFGDYVVSSRVPAILKELHERPHPRLPFYWGSYWGNGPVQVYRKRPHQRLPFEWGRYLGHGPVEIHPGPKLLPRAWTVPAMPIEAIEQTEYKKFGVSPKTTLALLSANWHITELRHLTDRKQQALLGESAATYLARQQWQSAQRRASSEKMLPFNVVMKKYGVTPEVAKILLYAYKALAEDEGFRKLSIDSREQYLLEVYQSVKLSRENQEEKQSRALSAAEGASSSR